MAVRNHIRSRFPSNPLDRTKQRPHLFGDDIELFAGLDDDEIARIGERFTVVRARTGFKLGRQGTLCQGFVVLIDGQIGVAADGLPIGVLSSGSFFGELPLLSEMGDQRHRTGTTVLTESMIAVADPREFSGLVRDHPVVAERLHAMADHRRTFIEKVTEEHARGVEVIDEPYPVHVDG